MADLKITFAQASQKSGSDLFDLALEDLDRTATLIDVRYGVGQVLYTHKEQLPETGLQLENTLTTAVLWSLFTDARISEEELPEGYIDQRGWLGDDLEPDSQPWGSKLWLITDIPGKASESRRQSAERYAREALQWMVTDGVASRIETRAWWIASYDQRTDGRLGIHITIYGDNAELIFESKWALSMQQEAQGTYL